jgi:hypothetical protein
MGLGLLAYTLAALVLGQTTPAAAGLPAGQNGEVHEIRVGHDPQPLPFRLNLDRRARPPRSLRELVDRLYAALPADRLDMFAAYYGSNDFERIRARYDSTVEFFYGLYTIEILHRADRVWGFSDAYFPLGPARRCAGDDFVDQVAIQLGTRRLSERGSEGVVPPLRNTADAYGMAARISRQLFALCDRLHPPRFRARQAVLP